MTKEDIIKLALEAGLRVNGQREMLTTIICSHFDLERFATLVADAAIEQERKEFAIHAVDIARRAIKEENEACAQICLSVASHMPKFSAGGFRCCEAIRERGQA